MSVNTNPERHHLDGYRLSLNVQETIMPNAFLRRWQFSIRELLMLTVIVALLLTIWRLVDLSTFHGTAFLAFDPTDEIESVAQEIGYPSRGGDGGGGGSSNDRYGFRKLRYRLVVPADADAPRLVAALHNRFLQRLADAGCDVLGGGSETSQDFSVNYRQGNTLGVVDVDCYLHDGHFHTFVLLHEVHSP